MTREEVKARYKDVVLPENKAPFHFEKMSGATEVQAYNPMCGDKFTLFIQDAHDLGQTHFHGIGCAISKASTSLMLRSIAGMSKDEVVTYCKKFIQAIDKDESFDEFPEGLQVLGELKKFEGRTDCIQLGWKALYNYLTGNK